MSNWIDLTIPLSPDIPRWSVEFGSIDSPSWHKASTIKLPVHCGTHLDSPLHYIPGGPPIETFPLELVSSRAFVLDLSDISANGAIGVDELQARWPSTPPPTILLRTDWPQRAWRTPAFWAESPYVTDAAAQWLAKQPIQLVGYDFPQDYVIRRLAEQREVSMTEFGVHLALLGKGIWQIEYLTNLHKLGSAWVEILVCPLSLMGLEASPVRVLGRAITS